MNGDTTGGGFELCLADALKLEAELFKDTMLDTDVTSIFRQYNDLPCEKRRDWIDAQQQTKENFNDQAGVLRAPPGRTF